MKPRPSGKRAAILALTSSLALVGLTAIWLGSSDPGPFAPSGRDASASAALWLGDFESDAQLARWRDSGVVVTLSTEGATHGHRCAKLQFPSGSSSVRLRAPFTGDPATTNWNRYGALRFDLFNAGSRQSRIVLQIKDRSGGRYSEQFQLGPGKSERALIRISDLIDYVDTAHVSEVRFFRWRDATPAVFRLDAVRLEPASSAGAPELSEPRLLAIEPGDHWQVRWTTALTKVFREPKGLHTYRDAPVTIDLARGEAESAQILIIGAVDRPMRVHLDSSELETSDGIRLNGDVEVRTVAFVRTRRPYYPVPAVGEWPDPLPPGSSVEVPAGKLQPFWFTVRASRDASPGTYRAWIRLRGSDRRAVSLALEVRVRGFALPQTPYLQTSFDLYSGQLRKAYERYVPGGGRWRDRLGELERLYSMDLLRHRISPSVNLDPDAAGAMSYLRTLESGGLTAVAVGAWGGRADNLWPEDGAALASRMSWYANATERLRLQGSLGRAYAYVWDEPSPGLPAVPRILAEMHRAAPDLRRLVALHEAPGPSVKPDWLADADIVVLRNAAFDPEIAASYRKQGKEVWLYTSGPAHPHASLLLDYPAISHRILPWLCWKYELKGLLHWTVNYWSKDPWKDPMAFGEQNGGGVLYYPGLDGPVPSLRLEVLRDGLEDYDYLEILRRRLAAARGLDEETAAAAERLLRVEAPLVESMRRFTGNAALLLERRREVADMIERLPALE